MGAPPKAAASVRPLFSSGARAIGYQKFGCRPTVRRSDIAEARSLTLGGYGADTRHRSRRRPGGGPRHQDRQRPREDTLRALVRWTRGSGLRLRGIGVDLDPDVVNAAAAASGSFPEIRIVRGDALQLPFRAGGFDYVVSSMLLHYFSADAAAALLRTWGALASRALIVSELERHWFPCLAIRILGRVSRRSLFREGSRRTVLRGFTADELCRLAARAGFGTVQVRRHFPFRLTLVAWHDGADPGGAPALTASPGRPR
jgi:SAM-dependent methyltransferase